MFSNFPENWLGRSKQIFQFKSQTDRQTDKETKLNKSIWKYSRCLIEIADFFFCRFRKQSRSFPLGLSCALTTNCITNAESSFIKAIRSKEVFGSKNRKTEETPLGYEPFAAPTRLFNTPTMRVQGQETNQLDECVPN